MSQLSIPCTLGMNNVLFPAFNQPPITNAIVDFQQTDVGGRTAVLKFNGMPQAFLTLDDTGRVIGYTMTVYTEEARQSVENIISAL